MHTTFSSYHTVSRKHFLCRILKRTMFLELLKGGKMNKCVFEFKSTCGWRCNSKVMHKFVQITGTKNIIDYSLKLFCVLDLLLNLLVARILASASSTIFLPFSSKTGPMAICSCSNYHYVTPTLFGCSGGRGGGVLAKKQGKLVIYYVNCQNQGGLLPLPHPPPPLLLFERVKWWGLKNLENCAHDKNVL